MYCRAGGQCGGRCAATKSLTGHHAHHLTYIAGNREDAPSWGSNGWLPDYPWLVCLCEDCHRLMHRLGCTSRLIESRRILRAVQEPESGGSFAIDVPYNDFRTTNDWFLCEGRTCCLKSWDRRSTSSFHWEQGQVISAGGRSQHGLDDTYMAAGRKYQAGEG